MDSQKLNRWLTLAANVSVITGIVFLAVEVRQNSDMVRAQTRNQLSERAVELFSVNMNDHAYADLLFRGNNLDELSVVERYQYGRHRNAWVTYWNNMVYQYRMGMYDKAEFDHQMSVIRSDMEIYPGLKVHWCENRRSASNELREALEANQLETYCTD